MIEKQIGNSYPVDGESYAHGKATDFETTYEYDDIYELIVEALIDDPYATTIVLGTVTEDIEQFLGVNYTDYIILKCDEILIDDEYGEAKHFNLIEEIVTDLARDDLEITYEYTEMV